MPSRQKPTCSGHVIRDREQYVAGQDRPLLDKPRPCRQFRPTDAGPDWKCDKHGGGAPQVKAVEAERRFAAAARKLIPDVADRTPIGNPLERLLELASEADAFRESLRHLANALEGDIRYRGQGQGAEQLRAEVATYRQALKDTTDMLVAIAKLDIEKMLARVTLAQAEQALASLRAGMDEAALTDEQKRTVMTSAGRHLRAVAG